MTLNTFKPLLFTLALLFTTQLCAGEPTWKLAKNRNNIKVYTAKFKEWPFESFKAETLVDGSLSNVLGFMEDVENYQNWMWQTSATKRLKTYADDHFIAYGIQEISPLLKKREFIVRNRLHQDNKRFVVEARMQAEPDFLPINNRYLRITAMSGKWTFIPIAAQRTKIIYEGHANPGGFVDSALVPKWLVNKMLIDLPYTTLLNIHKYDLKKYQINSPLLSLPDAQFFEQQGSP